MIPRQFIARMQSAAGRRRWSLRLAVLLRNQCNCVIRNAFNDSNEIRGNGESRVAALLAAGAQVVVDAGANVGDWTAEVLDASPGCRALLFDASQQAVAALRSRFSAQPSVEVIAKGVSDRAGELVFHEEPNAGKTSSFSSGFSVPGAVRRVVEVTTIDAELERRGLTHVDLIKIDVEGYDMRAMRGASALIARQAVEAIQFEYNAPWATTGGTLGEAVTLLTGAGYEVYALKSAGLFTFDYRRTGEFFGYANFLAASPRAMASLRPMVAGAIP
jgi:FkbM family methyltransferase